jgi:hypothetical protein
MADGFEAFHKRVLNTIDSSLQLIGQEAVDHTKDLLSRPVEYRDGTVIRSVPPQPPRLEEGKLQAGIRSAVDRPRDNVVELTYSASREGSPLLVLEYLELGDHGAKGPRPFMQPIMDTIIEPQLISKVVKDLKELR